MYILTRAEPLENSKDKICRVHVDAGVEKQYLKAGYQIHERRYKLKSGHKEYAVICPEFRKKGAEPAVAVPDFLVPGRPYPVYIYAYAIDLYASMPEKGQRWVAEETRKRFDLASFAHTTLGRALKSFVRCTRKETAAMPEETSAMPEGAAAMPEGAAAEPEGTAAGPPDACKEAAFPRARSTDALRRQAALVLADMPLLEERQQHADAILRLARELFKEYRRFLL
jgi:hypothetical protein